MKYNNLDKHYEALHNNPPKPFNPLYDPKAKDRAYKVVKSMELDGYYEFHSRESCKAQYAIRYNYLKSIGE